MCFNFDITVVEMLTKIMHLTLVKCYKVYFHAQRTDCEYHRPVLVIERVNEDCPNLLEGTDDREYNNCSVSPRIFFCSGGRSGLPPPSSPGQNKVLTLYFGAG